MSLSLTMLYIEEETAETIPELENKLSDPGALIFDKICDEVFADG